MRVPGRAVRTVGVWQLAQLTCLNSASPASTSAVIGALDGAFVERMKSAKALTSTPSSSGSATRSKRVPKPTNLPPEVFSSGNSGLVMPISLLVS
jgi:hypothetical protein